MTKNPEGTARKETTSCAVHPLESSGEWYCVTHDARYQEGKKCPKAETPTGRKEWPILFQGRLVRANIAGRKNQTRRVGPGAKRWLKAEAGDILWTRETWAPICRIADSPQCHGEDPEHVKEYHYFEYRADTGAARPGEWPEDDPEAPRWRPSIHMPRAACRQLLELREKPWEEDLHDITEANAIGEGLEESIIDPGYWQTINDAEKDPRDAFRVLWDSINAKRKGGKYAWKRNPTVTVIPYRRSKT